MNNPNTFKIAKGDVIKFGRVRFQVKKLVIDKSDIELTPLAAGEEDYPNESVLQNKNMKL